MLPHEPPSWIDPAQEIWFLTLVCQPRGRDHLTDPAVAAAVLDSVRWRHEHGHWYAHLFLLMPDHCHAVLSFGKDRENWVKTVRHWKHWLAAQHGISWQIDFFDHRLRNDESFEEKVRYVLENPVRAGLAAHWEQWPHRWSPPDAPPFTGFFTGLPR